LHLLKKLSLIVTLQGIVLLHRLKKRSPRRQKNIKKIKGKRVKERKIDMTVIHMKMLGKTLMHFWQPNTSNSKRSSKRMILQSSKGV
jgi:hypothetical protein